MLYTIVSRNQKRRAEIAVTQEGLQLNLKSEGESSPFFTGRLNEMLSYSTGRPWRLDTPGLRDVQVSEETGMLRISGFLDKLYVTLSWTFDEQDLLRMQVSWENRSNHFIREAAVGILFALPKRSREKVTIPHMIYNNNPSSDPNRIVPRLGVEPGLGFICEEHRMPIPCVNVEWEEEETRFLTLFSIPDFVETEDGVVHYGSLGAIQEESRITAVALSGVLMFNGEKDTCFIAKNTTQSYTDGYTDFEQGRTLTKIYALDWGVADRRGHAFREIVRKGDKLFAPVGSGPLSLDEMIRLKTNAMDDRYRSGEQGAAGYIKFTDSNGTVPKHPLHYMYGWTGQCLKLAWCDAKLGIENRQEKRVQNCRRAVDFYVKQSRTEVPGVRHSMYRLNEGVWDDFYWNKQPVVSSRSYGETIADLAEITLLFRENGLEVPRSWIEALRESADFLLGGALLTGIYPSAWRMDGTPADDMITAAGIPCLIALVKAYWITQESNYLEFAERMMQRYYELHVETFERPFARSTLDAKCEDKEAGMYFFLAAYELFLLTRDERYQEWAEIAADWLLTFVYVWNPAYNQGSAFRNTDFSAVGWPGVSVQNHHLDVFFPTYEFWKFGRLTGKEQYERWGRVSLEAMGQGICTKPGEWGFSVAGEQGEGFFQTYWNHRGHSNKWNPSWVIALVLHNALRFRDTQG
ncbi:hypothetical protein P5G65_10645 [Paenibacillus chondroitinus]|uniref:Uncharacterized protein n=1 Tax=Paenibacillus chondroitinus TaxID=59842 RepID=A0ABU6D9D0_9BACL|nr:hypothetical protein [Paenibacillus chondroitinus]MCY9656706.1 hypothetical protein [Paenibacillus anseongense]MEB4794355.1 hypothetical protein [Paenibacillus chondroitinus]